VATVTQAQTYLSGFVMARRHKNPQVFAAQAKQIHDYYTEFALPGMPKRTLDQTCKCNLELSKTIWYLEHAIRTRLTRGER